MPHPARSLRRPSALTLVALAGLVGCTPEGSSPDRDATVDAIDAMPDAISDDMGVIADDMYAIDAMPPDADPPPEPCGPSDVTWPVDPFGVDGQIHPAVAGDGDGVWVVYNRPTPDGATFDVWATRLGCDGVATVLPFEVSADPTFSDVDPSIAIGAERIAIAWTNDVSDADPNLIARYRLLDRQGAPLGPPQRLQTRRVDADFAGGHWMLQVAATDDGFVIVGARGVEERSAFQVFAQRLDAEGQPIGSTASAERDMTQQLEPDVGVDADGTIWLAWGEGDQGAGAVMVAAWAPPYDGALEPAEMLSAPAGGARISAGRRVFGVGFVQRGGGTDVAIRDLVRGGGVDLGEMGQFDLQPAVAQRGAVGMAAWFRRIRGNRASLWTRPLDLTDRLRASGPARAIPSDTDAAPYPMAVAPLSDGRFVVVWTGGEPPAYRIFMRAVAP